MRGHKGRQHDPALLSWTRGSLSLHPAPSLHRKASLMRDLSLKGYRKFTRLGKSGNPTSKLYRRHASALSVTPTPPWIPTSLQTPLLKSMGLCTTETPCDQKQTGGAPKFLHQAQSLRTNSSITSADSCSTWCLQRQMTMLFLKILSRP